MNAMFVGDVMKWTLEKSKNRYCDIAFKVDIRLLQSQFEGLLFRSAAMPFGTFLDDGKRAYEPSILGSVLNLSPVAFSAGVVFE